MATGSIIHANLEEQIHTVYNGALAKTCSEVSYAFDRLNQLGNIEYGVAVERVSWPAVKSSHELAANIPDSGALPDASREEITKAYLDWAIYIETLRIGRVVQMGATSQQEFFKTTQGKDLIASEMNRVIPIMARSIHLHIISLPNPGAYAMKSLGEAVANNSNVYAGIARATNAFWQPYVDENAGVNRVLTTAMLENMQTNLKNVRGALTTEVWCGSTAFNAMRAICNTVSPSRNTDPDRLSAGAREIFWEGIPFVDIPGMDANLTLWLDMTSDEGIKLKFQHPKDFIVKEEATGSYDNRWSVAAHAILQVHNPWKQGALADVY